MKEIGFVKLDRKVTKSDVYKMSPLYLRVFERLILEANYKDNLIPYHNRFSNKSYKKLIKRGERVTSIRQIAEWVAWYERGIKRIPNSRTIKNILDWLIANEMIKIYSLNESNRLETHYIIVNYETYQGKDKTKVTESKHSLHTNKNSKECKEIINPKNPKINFPMDTKNKEKNYLYSVVKLLMAIWSKEKSCCFATVQKLLKHKAEDELTYIQKCLMLMFIIKANRDRINESKYIGILTNQYRELSYSDFKNKVFSDSVNTYTLVNKNFEVLN